MTLFELIGDEVKAILTQSINGFCNLRVENWDDVSIPSTTVFVNGRVGLGMVFYPLYLELRIPASGSSGPRLVKKVCAYDKDFLDKIKYYIDEYVNKVGKYSGVV